MKSMFGGYHPIINFAYFCAVILLGMFLLHPVLLAISVAASATYAVRLGGKETVRFIAFFVIPVVVAVTVLNPILNHRGVTILTYLGDNPITLEAIVYGIVSGWMFASILLWFSCYNVIMTSDKFVYLFGRILPAMSLIFSMVLRFVPRFTAQIKVISQAQKCVGRDIGNGSLRQRAKHGVKILSIMVTWALENAIDTADSMKSRGYGLPGRTSFSLYRFDRRDLLVGILMILLVILLIGGAAAGTCGAQYYPEIQLASPGPMTLLVYGAYFVLCFLPMILDGKEEFQWRHSQSII